MAAVKQSMVDTNSVRLHVLEQGAGPAVLLLHGFPETSHAWRHQLAALAAAGYRAIAPDLRGYGGSSCPQDPASYTTLDAIGDLVGLLDALGEPQCVVVGNDWGATIAWQAAQSWYYIHYFSDAAAAGELDADPAATLAKIYFHASGDVGERGQATPNPFGMVDRRTGYLAALPAPTQLPAWFTAADLDTVAGAYARSGFQGGLSYYRNLDRNWALQGAFEGVQVTVPALYLAGARDTGLAMPGMQQIIADMPRLAPDLRGSHVIAGAGHWLPQEAPAEVNAQLLAFLQGL
jgi:pimeloyl-ACP methyl ester carboxylesterase